MKNTMKRAISMIMAMVMAASMSISALAADIPVIDMGTFHNVYSAVDGAFNLSDWDNYITNMNGEDYIVLENYNGTDKEITIKGKAKKNGLEYQVLLKNFFDTESQCYHSIFENNTNIERVTFVPVDGTAVGIAGAMGSDSLFKGCTALENVDFNNGLVQYGSHKLYSISGMFEGCTSLKTADLTNLDLSECTKAEDVFKGCTGVTEICLDGADFSKTYTVHGMFEGCTSLEAADLTTATWGELAKYTSRMFADDINLSEITVPYDFMPTFICQEMFKVNDLTELTVKGNPSELFIKRLMPLMEDNNRYIGDVLIQAHVELDGAELEDGMFEFKLYDTGKSDDSLLATATNEYNGLITFGEIKVYDITKELKLVAVMTGNESVSSETEALFRDVMLELNEDGTLSIKE